MDIKLVALNMKIILISGLSGSGKSTIEANIRIAYACKGMEQITTSGNVAFLGKYIGKSGKPLRYPGFDNFRQSSIHQVIKKLSTQGIEYVILSAVRNFKNFAKQNPKYNVVNFYNYRSPEKIYKQRNKRRLSKKVNPKELNKIRKQVEKYSNIKKLLPNYDYRILKGKTKDRIYTVLQYIGYSGDIPEKLIRTPFSPRYIKHWK